MWDIMNRTRWYEIDKELERGEYVMVAKEKASVPHIEVARYVGTWEEVQRREREKEFRKIMREMKQNNALLERELRKAIEKAKKLKTERVEVVKMPKKPDANEIVLVALEGKSGEVLRRILDATS
jgi:glycyl-tRNA synthetase (class II)